MDPLELESDQIRMAVRVTGVVQGVGFRPFIYRLAVQERLGGFVRNDGQGVYIEIQGKISGVERFLKRIRSESPPAAVIASVESEPVRVKRAGGPDHTAGPPARDQRLGNDAGVAAAAAGRAALPARRGASGDPCPATESAEEASGEIGCASAGPGARRVASDASAARGHASFSIVESGPGESRPLPISPDLACCDACLREVLSETDRRRRYPFTNCTDCGPRFTILRSVPYDRPNTTMSGFAMCPLCKAEYDEPGDRRFHAQPNACPECGPELELVGPGDERLRGEAALERACRLLSAGGILAVKGVGGYHLACDGESEPAVSTLRRRKHRYDRPFALMVRDMETAELIGRLDDAERSLLESAAAPIVLLLRLTGGPESSVRVAGSVAPGFKRLGIMLPYTPLHHMLLRGGPRVLVMTSGNVSEEPIAYLDEDAKQRLSGVADVFLLHNRPIRARCDDSVMWLPDGGRPQMIRRSRGYVPAPLSLPAATPVPILAVGGYFKNAFCIADGHKAYLSHHIGDTSNAEALRSFEDGVEHFKALFSVKPDAVAYDMHPEYPTTKYARKLEVSRFIPVQHHHAHVASCMADNGVPSGAKVLGVAFDGTGYGPDGTIWGGEFLVCTYSDFERYAHLGYMPLPGGEAAVREPWRLAAFAAERILGEDFHRKPLPFAAGIDMAKWRVIGKAVGRGVNAPLCCSVGRLFDCVSALLGVRSRINYEGQAAVELEALAAADPTIRSAAGGGRADRPPRSSAAPGGGVSGDGASVAGEGSDRLDDIERLMDLACYPIVVNGDVIEWEPIVGGAMEDAIRGEPIGLISAKFHRTLAEVVLAVAKRARRGEGLDSVALSGGVFMNEIMHRLVVRLLRGEGFAVHTHSAVPANDGGIAFGQAAVAAAKLAGV